MGLAIWLKMGLKTGLKMGLVLPMLLPMLLITLPSVARGEEDTSRSSGSSTSRSTSRSSGNFLSEHAPTPSGQPRLKDDSSLIAEDRDFPNQGMIRSPLRSPYPRGDNRGGDKNPSGTSTLLDNRGDNRGGDNVGDNFDSRDNFDPGQDFGAPSSRPSSSTSESAKVTIHVDDLAEQDRENVGLMMDNTVDPGVWRGSNRAVIERLLHPSFVTPPMETMRRLLDRLLTSPTVPPAGERQASLTALRIAALYDLGRYNRALQLYDVVFSSADEAPESARRNRVEMLLAVHRLGEACSIGFSGSSQGDVFWRQLAIFCEILRQGYSAEQLDFDLEVLGEIAGKGGNFPTFARLARQLLSGANSGLNSGSNSGANSGANSGPPLPVSGVLDTLLLAMARSASVPIAADIDGGNQPLLWQALAIHPGVDPLLRLEMAERAFRLGVIDAVILHRILGTLSAESFIGADGADDAGGMARWRYRMDLLRRILQEEEEDAGGGAGSRVEKIRDFLELSRDGELPIAARLVEPWLRELSPTPENLVFASVFIRAFLALGEWEQARAWYQAAQDADHHAAALEVWPLMRLAFAGTGSFEDVPVAYAQKDIVWIQHVMRQNMDQAQRQGEVFFGLLQALGDDSVSAGRAVLFAVAVDATLDDNVYRMPRMLDWGALNDAVVAGRVGEAILIASHMVPPPRRAIHPVTMMRVIEALRRLGLQEEARNLALETAFDHGL